MAEENKNMTSIDDESLENVAGGYESTYGNPNQSQHEVGDKVQFWNDDDHMTDGYVRAKRWGVYHYGIVEDSHEWIYTIEGKFDQKMYERPERQVP